MELEAKRIIIRDYRLANLITIIIFSLFVINFTQITEAIMHVTSSQVSLASKVILGMFCLLVLPKLVLKKENLMFVLLILMFSLLFLAYDFTNDKLVKSIAYLLTINLPLALAVMSVRNLGVFYDRLLLMSNTIAALLMFAVVYLFATKRALELFGGSSYSMGLSHALILPSMFLLGNYLREKSLLSLFFSCFLLFMILMTGSRSVFLALFIYFLATYLKHYFLQANSHMNGKMLKGLLYPGLLGVLLISLYFKVATTIFDNLQNFNIQSRSIRLFTSSEGLTHDSGRSSIYKRLLIAIIENPWKIKGYLTDQRDFNGGSAHNFILEMLYDFGVFGGLVPIAFWLYACFLSLKIIKRNNLESEIMLVFFAESIPLFMLHKEPLTSINTWLWLGFVINVSVHGKNRICTADKTALKRW